MTNKIPLFKRWTVLCGALGLVFLLTACPPPVSPINIPPTSGPGPATDSNSEYNGPLAKTDPPSVTGPETPPVDKPPVEEEDDFTRLLKAYDKAGGGEREQLVAQLVDYVDGRLSGTELRLKYEKLKESGRNSFPMGLVGFKLAKTLFHVRDYDQSRQIAEELPTLAPTDEWSRRGTEVLSMIDLRLMTAAKTVGVLLPLSGRHKLYGEKSLEAIKIAFDKYPDIKLVIEDSQGDANVAAAAVDKLVKEDHVIAIIGPITNMPSRQAAQKAEELEVPIILLAFQEGLPEIGSYVFRNALTAEQQAQAISELAFNKFGYSRFAILYPSTSFGRNIANAFWDEIDAHSGEVRAVETYPADEANFQPYIKKMVGRYYLDARTEYWTLVHEIKAKNLPPHKESAAIEKAMRGLPPVTDFDAIFIPDYHKPIGLIAPSLAFEDIILTRDKKELERIKKATGRSNLKPVTLFGNSQWNNSETIRRGQKNVEGAVFVDNFYLENPDQQVLEFVQSYKARQNGDPSNTEAQAYDSAAYLADIIIKQAPTSRAAMRQALIDYKNFKGVTGLKGFAENGEGRRQLFNFIIKNQLIKLLEEEDIPQS